MSAPYDFGRFLGTGAMLSVDASTSTGEGTRYVLPSALANWGLQVVAGSCTATVTLGLGTATSSDASLTTVLTWQSSSNGGGHASGATIWSTAAYPANVAAAVLDAGASSGGVSAWIVGAP